jgi:hypothetical protein
MNNIENYLKEIGFIENDWGFLSNTMNNIEFILMKDPLTGYTLSYSYFSKRIAENSEIPLGKTPSIDQLKNSIKEVKNVCKN